MNSNLHMQHIATLLDTAQKISADRLSKLPKFGPYIHAAEQIKFIRDALGGGVPLTQEQKDHVDIALMAVKELDAFDPDYSDVLCDLSFMFKRL